jgi:hypothetical protein
MMEWVLRDIDNADPYVDDIIIGSTGKNLEGGIGKPSKGCKKESGYIERTDSDCRSPQGKYVYEGIGILWADSQESEKITSTGKIFVNTKMEATANNSGAQGLSGSNQLLFLLCPQLLYIYLFTNVKTTSRKGRREEGITKSSSLRRRRSTCL